MNELNRLADLIRVRNRTEAEIARLIGRPGQIGHVGEYIAVQVFAIDLELSAASKAIDGWFASGPLEGRSVNVKWYAKQQGLLDITPKYLPDFYLVLTGPRSAATSSRGAVRPWLIDAVHLFEASTLVASLAERGVKIGVATSVAQVFWLAAEIYPNARCRLLQLNREQRQLLDMFSSATE